MSTKHKERTGAKGQPFDIMTQPEGGLWPTNYLQLACKRSYRFHAELRDHSNSSARRGWNSLTSMDNSWWLPHLVDCYWRCEEVRGGQQM